VRFAKGCGADLDNVAIAISVAVTNGHENLFRR
jgi:hypothetical protein